MARFSLCLLAVCCLAAPAREERGFPTIDKTTVGAGYHRFLVLRCDGNVLALFIMPNPRHGLDGIVYHWFLLTDGTDRFFVPWPAQAVRWANTKVVTGAGETHEGENRPGNGDIKAGPYTIEWSKGGLKNGWLYFAGVPHKIELYADQFERLEDCSGNLDPKRWRTIRDQPPRRP